MTYKISYEKGEITQNYLRIIASPDTGESLYLYYSPISEKREDAFLLIQEMKKYLYIKIKPSQN